MKMNAKGDSGIPQTERVYFMIHPAPSCGSLTNGPFFFSKVWSVGKVVDTLASHYKLQNNNNVPSAKKLRLFTTPSGEALTLSSSLDDVTSSGVITSGDVLVMSYVDNDVTKLDNMDDFTS